MLSLLLLAGLALVLAVALCVVVRQREELRASDISARSLLRTETLTSENWRLAALEWQRRYKAVVK